MASLETQLTEVDKLLAKGLISDVEAQTRRTAVLSGTVHESDRSGGIAVLIFSVIGGVFGVIFGLIAMAVGGASNSLDEGSGDGIVGLGISAIAAAAVGMVVGGVYFSGRARTMMAWLLLGSAFWHLISISYFAIPGFLFLLLAAIFAWFGRK
jgi:hypothetical protein